MKIEVFACFKKRSRLPLPLFGATVRAGFPSPADDHLDQKLDLNEHLIEHPAATFFCRVKGDSMQGLGITDGTTLVVDRALTAKHGDIVIAVIDGGLTCKLLDQNNNRFLSYNDKYLPISITDNMEVVIEGVVTAWFKKRYVRSN